jgi:hypothetical protein
MLQLYRGGIEGTLRRFQTRCSSRPLKSACRALLASRRLDRCPATVASGRLLHHHGSLLATHRPVDQCPSSIRGLACRRSLLSRNERPMSVLSSSPGHTAIAVAVAARLREFAYSLYVECHLFRPPESPFWPEVLRLSALSEGRKSKKPLRHRDFFHEPGLNGAKRVYRNRIADPILARPSAVAG